VIGEKELRSQRRKGPLPASVLRDRGHVHERDTQPRNGECDREKELAGPMPCERRHINANAVKGKADLRDHRQKHVNAKSKYYVPPKITLHDHRKPGAIPIKEISNQQISNPKSWRNGL